MDYRQVTPEAVFEFNDFNTLQCPGGSASTNGSYVHQDWSPESMMTAGTSATTPPRSPAKVSEIGPALLPRVRPQDQTLSLQHGFGHGRTSSLPVNAFPQQFGNLLPQTAIRRSVSPGRADFPTPGSAPLAFDHLMMDSASRRPSMHSRTHSTSNVRSHSRNSSSTSIDASVLGRYGFPTYRHSPGPQPAPTNTGSTMSRTPSAMSHLAPIAMPNGHIQSYPIRRRTASPPAMPSRLSVEADIGLQCDWEDSTSTIVDYLTASNPKPSLTQRPSDVNHALQPYQWFDVRNVSSWSDFNISTIAAIPNLLNLLNVNVGSTNLPAPARGNLNPETHVQLAQMCANHHAAKVNAALKVAQGDKHMVMRTLQQSDPTRRPQPEFVSNYQSDIERTIHGDGRGRVVGIVKCYDSWNSGFRNGNQLERVKYLRGLARLHHFMREHGCRYGFIMTEIELVCVRTGVTPDSDQTVPLFGCLEVAAPIQISTSGKDANGNLQMTVGLALWYLHMLAKEQPMPGQFHWKLEVGAPAAMTRKHHLPRDEWMPKPITPETRAIRKIRGWIWPNEPLNKKECGRGKRRS